jgi:hypothetical protein
VLSAAGPTKTGYGNNWVIAAVVVMLPMISRPVAVPVLAKLVIKDTSSASRLWLARRMALIHSAGTGTARHGRPRRAGLAPDSSARAWTSSGSQVQMMTSADGLLGTPGPIRDLRGQRGSIDDGIGVRCAEIGELAEDVGPIDSRALVDRSVGLQ